MSTNTDEDVTLSVVVFFRNEQAVIETCISSVMDQKDAIDQLIVIDDGSNDDSLQVVQQYLDASLPTHVIRHEQSQGINQCLNEGLAAAEGHWVHFLAGDDFVLPGFYGRSRDMLERNPTCGVCSAYVQDVDADGAPQGGIRTPAGSSTAGYISPDDVVARLYKVGSWFEGVSCIFKRASLVRIGGFDPQLQGFADALCCWTIAAGEGACFIPEILASKRDVWKGHGFELYGDHAAAKRIWSRAEDVLRRQQPQRFTDKVIARFKKRWDFEQKHNAIMKAYFKDRGRNGFIAEFKKTLLTKIYEIYFKPFDVLTSVKTKMSKSFGGRP
ncbi:glycosyltransferase family 2 protein [Magnetovibrio sp.]|uniref:glycosyltransferase family 2 protein n=1 Tax=Magnetovibrio sp. TaxID=2024836 RepID=UPI002F93BEE3